MLKAEGTFRRFKLGETIPRWAPWLRLLLAHGLSHTWSRALALSPVEPSNSQDAVSTSTPQIPDASQDVRRDGTVTHSCLLAVHPYGGLLHIPGVNMGRMHFMGQTYHELRWKLCTKIQNSFVFFFFKTAQYVTFFW